MCRIVIEDNKKINRSKIIIDKEMIRSNKITGSNWTACPTRCVIRLVAALLALLTLPVDLFAQTLPTLSTESSRTYYHINVAKDDAGSSYQSSYNISPTATVSVKNSTTDEEVWYFIDTWDNAPSNITNTHLSDYCYIVNAKSGEYLYYTGTTSIGNQSNIIEMKARDASNAVEDRFKFGVVQSPNSKTTTYVIYPKILGENNTSSLTNYGHLIWLRGSNSSNANLSINKGNDWNSQLTFISATDPTCSTPTITNTNGTISISSATANAKIYYTTDGTTPSNSNGTLYSTPFALGYNTSIIKAIAYKSTDDYVSVVCTLNIPRCDIPEITNTAGSVVITCSMTDATIYYTTDGSDPIIGTSSIYSSEFTPGSTATIKAIAVKDGYSKSPISARKLDVTLSGSGTAVSPYLISSDDDFTNFVLYFASNPSDAEKVYKITADIDASGLTSNIASFSGTLTAQAKDDGTFPVITGLNVPLFATATDATISNIILKRVIINQDGNVGALAGTASGYSRIYNCGILPTDNKYKSLSQSTISSTNGYCGGLVGWLKDDSRVINCFSYANVTGGTDIAGIVGYNEAASNTSESNGKYTNLRTAVVNCVFYGILSGGTKTYPVYGGAKMLNNTATGINNYDFYRAESNINPTDYNCSWPAKEVYLTQFEFHRNLLNSNRELCGWWVGAPSAPSSMSTTDVQAVPKDASLMAKWVLDPNIAPYPILKAAGFYPSPVNQAPRPGETNPQRIDPDTKQWVSRASSTYTEMKNPNDAPETDGRSLGKITVTIKKNSADSGTNKDIIITAMDVDNNDFCYGKIQLPYYNSIFGNPAVQVDPTATAAQQKSQWESRYGGNYGDDGVVVGWEITDVTGGTAGTLTKDWQTGYNFADRNCTNKDKERVFAQGGYYYVPYGVSAITITAKWATAIYLDNGSNHSYDRVNVTSGAGTHFAPAGTRPAKLANGKSVITGNIKDNIPSGGSVYGNAIVLVGNHQYGVSNNAIGSSSNACTIMSADFDMDDEPDYCLNWQLGSGTNRQSICPIRFDFLPVVELGLGMKLDGSTQYYSLGCYRPLGHFEVTETSLIHFGQFEFSNRSRTIYAPIILNGGIFDQYTKGHQNNAFTTADDKIDYIILGGNVRMPSFTPGAHVNTAAKYPTRHCAVNVLGGNIDNIYLTGNYNNGVTPNQDNPHCYIDGGKFKQVAAAGKEGINGDVYFEINHSIIDEFYGGSTLADKLVTGDIHVTVDNSYVTKYCGGPKFGNMNLDENTPANNKTVTTNAKGTTFGVYYGGGNGGTSYVQYDSGDGEETVSYPFNWDGSRKLNGYVPGTYRNKATGYIANYDMEIVNVSTGTNSNKAVYRTYLYAAQFSATNTGPITNNLTDCKVLTNFYGGGNLGGVKGDVNSTLSGTTRVEGSVYGAGYSASIPEVTIYNKDKTPPTINVYTGIITPTPESSGTSITYTWTDKTSLGGNTLSTSTPTVLNVDGKNYFYTEESLDNLGAITGNVFLTITENTEVVGKVFKEDGTEDTSKTGGVYGGGDESTVNGNTTVTLQDDAIINGNVFGGGNQGEVSGNTTVNIME